MKRTLFAIAAALVLGTAVQAQRLVAYDPLAGMFAEVQPPTGMAPPSPPLAIYPPIPPLPVPPPMMLAPGDSSFDNIAGLNYYTDGFVVAATPTTDFPPAGPIPPVAAIPAAVLGLLGGPATGLAVDPIAGILWLASPPGVVVGVAAAPGMPIVAPAFVVPFGPLPITGLEWDGMTGSLLAVDVMGVVYEFTPGGAPVAPPLFPALPPFGIPVDLAIDKTGMLNTAGMRPIYIADGPVAYDVTLPFPVIFPLAVSPGIAGLAFVPHPAESAPFSGCPCGPMFPTIGTTGPMTAGNGAFGLTYSGIVPGTLALFGLDFGFAPGFPLLNVSGCGVGLILGSPTMLTAIVFSDPFGTATYPLPLPIVSGFGPIYAQAFTLCGADPAGFVASPMQQINTCDV